MKSKHSIINSIAVTINTISIVISTLILTENIITAENTILYILILLIVISLGVNIVFLFWRFKQRIEVIDSPKETYYNYGFYKRFFYHISRAKQNIYIVGRGLTCKDNEEKNIADEFCDRLSQSLSKNVTIVRIQTRRKMDEYWSKKMSRLIFDHPNFKFYLLKKDEEQVTSTCVFDPDNSTKNVVKISFPVYKSFGTEKSIIAGPSVFVNNNLHLAQSVQQQILSLTSQDASEQIISTDFGNEVEIFDYLMS